MFSGARTLVMMTNFSVPNYTDTVESFDGIQIIHSGYSPKKDYINDTALLRTRRHHAYSLSLSLSLSLFLSLYLSLSLSFCFIGYKRDGIGIYKRTNNISNRISFYDIYFFYSLSLAYF